MTIQLSSVADRDNAIRELLETNGYVNADGSPHVPDDLDVFDPAGDADMGADVFDPFWDEDMDEDDDDEDDEAKP
jgi:hypothetical protein